DAIGIAGERRLIAGARRHLTERLVRAVIVEVPTEAIKAGLLLASAAGRRPRSLRLERAVHALMATILLRRAGLNPLELHTKLDPVHRQPRQSAGAGRRERRAVV